MKAICGVVSLHGAPIDAGPLDRMSEALWKKPPERVDCGLGVLRGLSTCLHRETGVVVVAQAWLEDVSGTEAEVILDAYLCRGLDAANGLYGDFSFAVWDPRSRLFLVARDHHGMSPIYYYADSQTLYFASSMGALLAVPDIPKRPNLDTVVRSITNLQLDGKQTGYESIQQLPHAHTLRIEGGKTRVEPYWSLGDIRPATFKSPEECCEAFLAVYDGAVSSRAVSAQKPAVSLSAGLDSSSVAVLAARRLARDGRRLQAFCSTPAYALAGVPLGRIGDEAPLVEAIRDKASGLDVEFIRAESVSPLDGIDRALALINQPIYGPTGSYWLIAVMEAAQRVAVDTLMTGQMGNLTVSWEGEPMDDARLRARQSLLLSWAKPLRDSVSNLVRGGVDIWHARSPIRLQYARSYSVPKLRAREVGNSKNAQCKRIEFLHYRLGMAGAYWNEIGSGFGVSVCDPTCDRRVLEFCLSTPSRMYRQNGVSRWLLRMSMEGLLPDSVRLGRARGLQSADIGERVRRSSREIGEALDELGRNAFATEILDLPKMRLVLDQLVSGQGPKDRLFTQSVLMRGLAAGRFLTRF